MPILGRRKRPPGETKSAYQVGFDTGARWGYSAGRMDERFGKSPYSTLMKVIPDLPDYHSEAHESRDISPVSPANTNPVPDHPENRKGDIL